MPQTRSTGLASTSTRSPVCTRNSRSAGSDENLCTLPSTTIPNRSRSHVASSKSRTSRPAFFASAGCSAASTRRSASASAKSRALPAIIQCSAVA